MKYIDKEIIIDKLAESLNITPGQYNEAKAKYERLSNYLKTKIKPLEVYLQRSFALGTVIRPIKNMEEQDFDIDVVCQMINGNQPLAKIKNIVGDALKESSYLKYLEEAYLIEKAKRYDVKGKKYIDTPLKYYFTDIGIRNSLINFRQLEKTHIMENIIYIELKRRGFVVDVGIVKKRKLEDNQKNLKQFEIDFIASKGSSKYYIQSAYSIESKEKREQELQSLLNVGDNFKKIVVVYDHFIKWQDEDGIIYISIYEFLLNEESLRDA